MSSFKINIDSEKFDDAIMRITCAGSLLTLVGRQFDGEGCIYSDGVMSEAVFGVGLLLSDAAAQLACNQ